MDTALPGAVEAAEVTGAARASGALEVVGLGDAGLADVVDGGATVGLVAVDDTRFAAGAGLVAEDAGCELFVVGLTGELVDALVTGEAVEGGVTGADAVSGTAGVVVVVATVAGVVVATVAATGSAVPARAVLVGVLWASACDVLHINSRDSSTTHPTRSSITATFRREPRCGRAVSQANVFLAPPDPGPKISPAGVITTLALAV